MDLSFARSDQVRFHSEQSEQGHPDNTDLINSVIGLIREVLREDEDLTIAQPALKQVICLLPNTHFLGAMRVDRTLGTSPV
jgi:hypothetical protein